jgi:hypothetical protein
MFITQDELNARLNSERNIINILRGDKNVSNPSAPEAHIPQKAPILTPEPPRIKIHNYTPSASVDPLTKENLPNESDRQRAARNARNSINQETKHSEYTVNPNIKNDVFRATSGILSASDSATNKEIQKEFGVTRNQITGAEKSKKKSLAEKIQRGRDKVSELALDRLMCTLGLLTDEKLSVMDNPKDIANVAASLAKVAGSMDSRSRDTSNGDARISLNINTPSPRALSEYQVIDV